MVSPAESTSSTPLSWTETFQADIKNSKVLKIFEAASNFFNTPEETSNSLKSTNPDTSLNNCSTEITIPSDLPVKNLFRSALSSIPFFPSNINFQKNTSYNTTYAICVILAITTLQHLAANYFSSSKKVKNTSDASLQPSFYDKMAQISPVVSKHFSIGSLTGTFTSWVFNQNPYIGAAIGAGASIPIGLGLDYIQYSIGDPTIRVIEKAAGKLYYGGRIFIEGTIAALVTPLALKIIPSVSENPNIDFPVRFALSALSSLTVLSHLESAYPSSSPTTRDKKGDALKSSPIISIPKFALQSLAISCIITHFFCWTSKEAL